MSSYIDIASRDEPNNNEEVRFFAGPTVKSFVVDDTMKTKIKPIKIIPINTEKSKIVDKSGPKRNVQERKKTAKDFEGQPLTMKMIIEEMPPKSIVVQYFKNLIEKYQDDSDDSEDDEMEE